MKWVRSIEIALPNLLCYDGFDDGAYQRQFAIKTTEDIEVVLVTPKEMLKLEA